MDNEQERNEHFQGFAKLLYDELGTLDTLAIQRGGDYTSFDVAAKKLIAQRAYDLVQHALKSIEDYEHEMCYESDLLPEARFDHVPDLTEWPNPPQPSPEPTSD